MFFFLISVSYSSPPSTVHAAHLFSLELFSTDWGEILVKVAEFACWEMGKNYFRKLRKTTPIIIMMKFAHCSVCYIRFYLFILDVFRNIYLNISFYTSPNFMLIVVNC
jgi:hypothetical protein